MNIIHKLEQQNSRFVYDASCFNSFILKSREKEKQETQRNIYLDLVLFNFGGQWYFFKVLLFNWVNGMNYFYQLNLLFSLFFLLFMNPIALFDTIHGFHCTISTNFYLYLQYFQQKV